MRTSKFKEYFKNKFEEILNEELTFNSIIQQDYE